MDDVIGASILALLFVSTIVAAGACIKAARRPAAPGGQRMFSYKYMRHPFDDWCYFSMWAKNRAEADDLAKAYYGTLVAQKVTVMAEFYPA